MHSTSPDVGRSNRRLFAVDESRQQLGNISRSLFYKVVKELDVKLVKIGRRSFLTGAQIDAIVTHLAGRR